MASRFSAMFSRMAHRRASRLWSRAAAEAGGLGLADLKRLRSSAARARREVDLVLRIADTRLAREGGPQGSLRPPLHSDWAWRPDIFSTPTQPAGIAAVENGADFGDARIFHDCRISELTIRQIRNQRDTDLSPFGVRLDVFRFDGSFLSLAIDLPKAAIEGLKLRHLVRLDCDVSVEKPIEIFARLNVVHGPNTEQVVRELPSVQGETSVDFDLAYTKLNEKRVEKAWIDIIFEGPELNQIVLRDLTFSRRPRAEI